MVTSEGEEDDEDVLDAPEEEDGGCRGGSRRRGARSPEEEDAGEDDGDVDVDDGMEVIQFNHPSESVEDGGGVQEDMPERILVQPDARTTMDAGGFLLSGALFLRKKNN